MAHAGDHHDDNELEALQHRRRTGIGKTNGNQVEELVGKKAEQRKEQLRTNMGGVGPQAHETVACSKGDKHHEEQAGEDLTNREQPERVHVIDVEQHACRGTRKTPKACTRKRSKHAHKGLARRAAIQAIAPSATLFTRCRIGSVRYRLLLCLPCRHTHVHTPLRLHRLFFVQQEAHSTCRTCITLPHQAS